MTELLHIALWLVAVIHTFNAFMVPQAFMTRASINPLLVSAGIQAGAGLISQLKSRPDVPNLVEPSLREAQRSRARVLELLDQQTTNLESSQAARGVTGAGAASEREALIRASNSAVTDIDSSLADLIIQAGNQQRNLEFQDATSRFNSFQSGISDLANAGSSLVALNSLTQNTPGPVTPEPVPDNQTISLLNLAAQQARVAPPEAFNVEPLRPKVDPNTGRITFGGGVE